MGVACEQLNQRYGVPLMVTEGHQNGQIQSYVAANVTGYGQWPLANCYYPVTPYSSSGGSGTGVQAREPWSGYWDPGATGSSNAAFTQFSAPNGECRYLHSAGVGANGHLHVPGTDLCNMSRTRCAIAVGIDCGAGSPYGQSVVIENTNNWNITVVPKGARPAAGGWHLWQTCPGQANKIDSTQWLVKVATMPGPVPQPFQAAASCTYTLTTSLLGNWAIPRNTSIPPSAPMPLPYADAFSTKLYRVGQQVRFFTAEAGSFEAALDDGGLQDEGVLRQVVTKRPIEWEHNAEPYSFMGDNRWPTPAKLDFAWVDYNVTVNARIGGDVIYPCGLVTPPNQSRVIKGVAGWQTGPQGSTPDQPAGTGGGGQKAVGSGCLSFSHCAVGSSVAGAAGCSIRSFVPGSGSNGAATQLFVVDEAKGTLACEQSNGTRLCVTANNDRLRNVTMQPCADDDHARQSWDVAALDASSPAHRTAAGGLRLVATGSAGGCLQSTRPGGHGYAVWVAPCNSSGWVSLDGTDANEAPWFRVAERQQGYELPDQTFVRVCGRISNYQRGGQPPLGYCLVADRKGAWFITAGGAASPQREFPRIIARGRLGATSTASLAAGTWVALTLIFKGSTVTAVVDGVVVVDQLHDTLSPYGMVAVGSGWHLADYARFSVVPV